MGMAFSYCYQHEYFSSLNIYHCICSIHKGLTVIYAGAHSIMLYLEHADDVQSVCLRIIIYFYNHFVSAINIPQNLMYSQFFNCVENLLMIESSCDESSCLGCSMIN